MLSEYSKLYARLLADEALAAAIARLNERRSIKARSARPLSVEIFARMAADFIQFPEPSRHESIKERDDRRTAIAALLKKAARLADEDCWLDSLAERLRTEATELQQRQGLGMHFCEYHTPTGRAADARRRAMGFCQNVMIFLGIADNRYANSVMARFVTLATGLETTPQQISEIHRGDSTLAGK